MVCFPRSLHPSLTDTNLMNHQNLAELAQTLFEESGDALFLFDPNSEQLLDVNPMAQRLSGFPRTELLAMPVRYLFRSEAQGGLSRLRAAYQKTGLFHSQEGFLMRHQLDGVWVPVNLTVTRLHTTPNTLGLITARDITERRLAQQQIRKREEQLREVLDSVSDCLWSAEVGDQGTLVGRYCSPVARRLTGHPAESFDTPVRWVEITQPEDRPRLQGALRNLLARTSDREEIEVRIARVDGAERRLRFSILSRQDADRRCLVIDGVVSDVTEHRRAEEAVRQRDERFRVLVERGSETIFLIDPTGQIRYASPACVLLAGFTAEELTGTSAFAHLVEEEVPRVMAQLAEALARPGEALPFLTRVRARDGSIRYVEGVGINRLNDPSIQAIVVHSRNVTERVQAEQALRESEVRYRTLVDNLVQSVFLKDVHSRFVAVNRRFCEELGHTEAEILGRTDHDFYPLALADQYRADDRAVLDGVHLEQEETNPFEGRDRIVKIIKTPVRNGTGEILGVLGIFWDVTDAHRMEEQLRQTQKMNAIGQLAGGVAHDFNNLLTGILGNLSLIQAQIPTGALKDMLATVEQAAWRAATLTSQLLGFSRRTMLRIEPVALNRTIDEVVGLLQRTLDPRIDFQTCKATDLWQVQADPGQMHQVLMNLCINARDALQPALNEPGGPGRETILRLETTNLTLDDLAAARQHVTARAGEYIRLRVTDTGTGIPSEVLPRIFEPFYTTKGPDRGTGLGLAMVFGIVQQHQGWIECQSTLGVGTSLDIYLPRANALPMPSVSTPTTEMRGGQETILLADDEDMLRTLGQMILRRAGYNVLLAEDGLRAVEMYRRMEKEVSLVILDLTMPRLSGRDAFRQIREINPRVRVIFTSGYSADYLGAEEHREIQGFVTKPFRPESLVRMVREALDKLMIED